MQKDVIILASSSPDPTKSLSPSTQEDFIKIHSSPTATNHSTINNFPSSTSPLFNSAPQKSEACIPVHSNDHNVIELIDTSFLEEEEADELPELSLPTLSDTSFFSQPSLSYSMPYSPVLFSSQPFLAINDTSSQIDKSTFRSNQYIDKLRKRIEKEQEKEYKEAERQEKKRQKLQDIQEKKNFFHVNKNRSKLECTQELLFLFHPSFSTVFKGPTDLFSKLKESNIRFKFDATAPAHCILCERMTDRQFNSRLSVWEPMDPPFVFRENWILMFLEYQKFCTLTSSASTSFLNVFQGFKHTILVIEGRSYERTYDLTTNQDPWFEVMHRWRMELKLTVVECQTRAETVVLLYSLFCELGAMPYLKSVYQEGIFFSDLKVKSAKGFTDTWRKFLMCIRHMSEASANAIIQSYPTIHSLYSAYKSDPNKAPLLLENIMVDREQSSKRIGPTLSKRIHAIFMSKDPFYEPYSV